MNRKNIIENLLMLTIDFQIVMSNKWKCLQIFASLKSLSNLIILSTMIWLKLIDLETLVRMTSTNDVITTIQSKTLKGSYLKSLKPRANSFIKSSIMKIKEKKLLIFSRFLKYHGVGYWSRHCNVVFTITDKDIRKSK